MAIILILSAILNLIIIGSHGRPQNDFAGGPGAKKARPDTNIGLPSDPSFNIVNNDGSYDFGYQNRDLGASFHFAQANARNVVRGRFGGRNPGTGLVDETVYTAGPRGFRPKGVNVHRRYDLSQSGPLPVGNKDDPHFDPNEDPSYSFAFRTRTYTRQENQDRRGDVTGQYSFLDDLGERHQVNYIAGERTGFHVQSPFPDSHPPSYGPLYRPSSKKARGHTSVQRGVDGSYRFVSSSADQRRTESSDKSGNVRGSYTFLDDKGRQHTVNYIAGPNIGYRVLKSPKDYVPNVPYTPNIPNVPSTPSIPPNIDSDDDIPHSALDEIIFGGSQENLNTAASGHVKPKPIGSSSGSGIGDSNGSAGVSDGNIGPSKVDFGSSGFGTSNKDGDKPDNLEGNGEDDADIPDVFGNNNLGGTELGPIGGNKKPFGANADKRPSGGKRPFGGTPNRKPFGSNGNRKPFGSNADKKPSFSNEGNKDFENYGDGDKDAFGSNKDKDYLGSDDKTSNEKGSDWNSNGNFGPNFDGDGPNQSGSYENDKNRIPLLGGSENRPTADSGSSEGRPPFGAGESDGLPSFVSDDDGRPISSEGSGNRKPIGSNTDKDHNRRPSFSNGNKNKKPGFNDKGTSGFGDEEDDENIDVFSSDIGGGDGDKDDWSSGKGGKRGYVRHTLLKNIGDEFIGLVPGVAVRAHVQSIDILPYGSRLPSPGEQLEKDAKHKDS